MPPKNKAQTTTLIKLSTDNTFLSMRSYLSNPKSLKAKVANSQSPIQKKRLLEFATQNLKTDKSMHGLSLKGDLNPQSSSSAKVIDFRREIERRYQHSSPNKHYKFPRNCSFSSSSDRSLESLKDIGEYDLHSQDFRTSVLLEKRKISFDRKEAESSRYSEKLSQLGSCPMREYLNDSTLNSTKNKIEGKCLTSRDHLKVSDLLENITPNSMTKKSLKMITSKSQKNVGANFSKPKKSQKEKEDSSSGCDYKNETRTFKLSDFDLSAKTINLNVNVNMNMNLDFKGLKGASTKQKPHIAPLNNTECFINCNFFPTMYTTKSAKDLKINVLKSPNHVHNLYKDYGAKTTREEVSKKEATAKATVTSNSTVDKSGLDLKSSYSIAQTNSSKLNNSTKAKVINTKQDRHNPLSENSFSSFHPTEGSKTSRENSKNKTYGTTKTLYQRMQQDLLQKLKTSGNIKPKTPVDSPLHKFVATSLTTRATSGEENPLNTKIKPQSPKLNNFLRTSMTSSKTLGQAVKQKTNSSVKTMKNSHSIEKKIPTHFKELVTKTKQKNDTLKISVDLRPSAKGESKISSECASARSSKMDKPKFKLNFQGLGLGQKLGAFSERVGQSSDRSDLKNRSHAEYFR